MCQQRGDYSAESYLGVLRNKEPNRPCKLHAALILSYYKVKQLSNLSFLSRLRSVYFFLDLHSHYLFLNFYIKKKKTLPDLVLKFFKSGITSIERQLQSALLRALAEDLGRDIQRDEFKGDSVT